jgi:ribosomal protein S21
MKIEVKDNNIEQALRVLKKKTSERWLLQSNKIKKHL